jgi:hypothetical protein
MKTEANSFSSCRRTSYSCWRPVVRIFQAVSKLKTLLKVKLAFLRQAATRWEPLYTFFRADQ